MVSSTLASASSLAVLSAAGLFAPFFTSAQAKAASLFNNGSYQAEIQSFYTTTGNPANYVVSPGRLYEGVASLLLDLGGGSRNLCTGGLLGTGAHILTAAHCLTDPQGKVDVLGGTANFGLPTGSVSRPITNIFVHEKWMGELFEGYDIAILELADLAPNEADRYDIYRASDEASKIGTKVGYGRSGSGNTGAILPGGIKRTGQNRYDASGAAFNQLLGPNRVSDAVLAYDFDNGLATNDAFGFWFGKKYADLGLGLDEVNSAPGDSGGPTFINGTIAGITSFGLRLTLPNSLTSDVDMDINSSFGEFSFDTRVSSYASWIDGILTNWNNRNTSSGSNPGSGNPDINISGSSNPSTNNRDTNTSGSGNPSTNNRDTNTSGSNTFSGNDPRGNNPDSDNSASVPEPSLLTGLIALGTGLLFKRNKRPRKSID